MEPFYGGGIDLGQLVQLYLIEIKNSSGHVLRPKSFDIDNEIVVIIQNCF